MDSFFAAIILFISLIPVYLFGSSPVQIRGSAMEPTLKANQYYLTSKVHQSSTLKRGDIVIYTPSQKKIAHVKRIIGLPGETIIFKNGRVFIDDTELSEPYIVGETQTIQGSTHIQADAPFRIPEGEYFLMGDNRPRSDDSRSYGTVKAADITKKLGICYKGCE